MDRQKQISGSKQKLIFLRNCKGKPSSSPFFMVLEIMSLKPFYIYLQYVLPKQAITSLAGRLANARLGWLTQRFIAWFIKRYQVDMQQAADSDIASYASFNAFFTRPLKAGLRRQAQAQLVCPVDGKISQCGDIQQGSLIQAKQHHYTLAALLAGDSQMQADYQQGRFATIYLSPRDYHRIHMPCAGQLLSMTYVPGSLFSVNPLTAEYVPGLFARNERVICEFQGKTGKFVMILVGATIVGSMATVWHGVVNPPRSGKIQRWDYASQAIQLAQGEEMGRFLLGSTVIVLLPAGAPQWHADWQAGKAVQLGEAMSEK
jgi:phosphatidylserine decarboxylase